MAARLADLYSIPPHLKILWTDAKILTVGTALAPGPLHFAESEYTNVTAHRLLIQIFLSYSTTPSE
jgi:hypothetical protein